MGYYDVLAKLFALFPQFMERVRYLIPTGERNSVKVEMADGQKLLFTYWNDSEWDLVAVCATVRRA